MSLNQLMDEFNSTYLIQPVPFTRVTTASAAALAMEEVCETYQEVDDLVNPKFNHHNAAKELLDIIYATAQKARNMGIDVDLGLQKLQISNLSKLIINPTEEQLQYELETARKCYPDVELQPMDNNPNSYRLFSPSLGKLIKPTTYVKADVTEALPDAQNLL